MPGFENERELLVETRDRLDGWLYEAREQAFAELFEGEDAIISAEELGQLDEIDSRWSRERGEGLWGADEYGIIPTGEPDEESTPHVVCTSHPQIPDQAIRGDAGIDDETRERLNEALWKYCERVTEIVQANLESFRWSADGENA